jgi:hypothetical protein
VQFENRCPKLKAFDNHWGAIFILKECHNNLLNYRRKNAPNSNVNPDSAPVDSDSDSDNLDNSLKADDQDDRVHKANARKAALQKAVACKAVKLQARAEKEA